VSDELHKLGEVLRAAREAKGVDLARVERDTKIRERYLAALEHGEYRELPGAVYTRGFLRNYGQYLGLDAEYLIDLFRLETNSLQAERPRLDAPPRPIAVRGRGAFVVTPNALAATILSIVVIVLVAYFGYEFWTFARTPDLRITDPAGPIAAYQGTQYTVAGVTAPNSRITVKNGQRENPDGMADASGAFAIDLKLVPGSNLITLIAHDPVTKRDSDAVTRTINVVPSGPTPSPAVALALSSPADAAKLSGPVTIAGTGAPGGKLTATAKATGAAPPTFSVVDGAGRKVAVKPAAPAAPKPLAIEIGADGSFSANLSLPPGSWELTVASGDGTNSVVRNLSVAPGKGLSGSAAVAGGASYLEVEEDGKRKSGVYGAIVADGKSVALKADERIRVRAGNAGAVQVTINGIDLGKMGGSGAVVEWNITRDK
jgi:cytoskeletal protein RodZ